ncbi:hypothetical protein LguiA_029441 [Lonicera macranthoides]
MSHSIHSTFFVILSCLFLFSSVTTAFNITKILSKYDGYGTFNNLLSQTKLDEVINGRSSITVLAVQDGSISSLSSKSQDVVKRILSNHIVLDYYDMQKLKNLKNGSASLTTLFQTSGDATGQQGFLKVNVKGGGEIKVGSAAKDAQQDVLINKMVASQPYNISVLDVSGPIIAPGIENIHNSPAQSPRKVLAPAPAPHKKSPAPAESPEMDPPSSADGPAEDGGNAPAPGKSGSVKGRGVNFLVGLMVFLVASFLAA